MIEVLIPLGYNKNIKCEEETVVSDHRFLRFVCKLGLTAGAIYAANSLIEKYATKNNLLQSTSSEFFNWRGVRIYYHKEGSGSPLLLLHDLHPAASAYEFHKIKSQLAQTHTVYTLDLPGFGRSAKEKQPYTNFYYVEVLREFIKTMALGKVQVVASNLSCPIALMAQIYDPNLFSKMILINPPSIEDMEVSPTPISRLKKKVLELPLIGTLIYNIIYSRQQIDLSFTEEYFYNPFHENTELVDTYYEAAHLGHGGGRFVAASLIGGFINMSLTYALKQLTIPAKILEGSETENADWVIKGWTGLNNQISSVSIKHTQQLPHLEEPELVVEEINQFLD